MSATFGNRPWIVRSLCMALLLGLSTWVLPATAAPHHQEDPFDRDELGVLVTTLADSDSLDAPLEDRIVALLEDTTIPVIRLDEVVADEEQAEALADDYRAVVTLYGAVTEDGIEVMVLVDHPQDRRTREFGPIIVEPESDSPAAYVLVGLGDILFEMADRVDPESNLGAAAEAYEAALFQVTAETDEDIYRDVNENLAQAYSGLASLGVEPVDNLQGAIRANEALVDLTSLESNPAEYAELHEFIGFLNTQLLVQLDPDTDLSELEDTTRSAVAAYEEALRVYTLEDDPERHAQVLFAVAPYYTYLGQLTGLGEDLYRARSTYETLLDLYPQSDFPTFYPNLLTDLANVDFEIGDAETACINYRKAVRLFEGIENTEQAESLQDFVDDFCVEPAEIEITPVEDPAEIGTQTGSITLGTGQSWEYVGEAGEQLVIIVEAANPAGRTTNSEERLEDDLYDTLLELYAPDGDRIAWNDDALVVRREEAESTNSRIEVTLPEDGTYTIVVRAYGDESFGEYTLTLEAG
jgi:tetratricopeptide (TPR) repeat protein